MQSLVILCKCVLAYSSIRQYQIDPTRTVSNLPMTSKILPSESVGEWLNDLESASVGHQASLLTDANFSFCLCLPGN